MGSVKCAFDPGHIHKLTSTPLAKVFTIQLSDSTKMVTMLERQSEHRQRTTIAETCEELPSESNQKVQPPEATPQYKIPHVKLGNQESTRHGGSRQRSRLNGIQEEDSTISTRRSSIHIPRSKFKLSTTRHGSRKDQPQATKNRKRKRQHLEPPGLTPELPACGRPCNPR